METFNKNWLAILLIVIVFFGLGFLTGRVTSHHKMGRYMAHRMMRHSNNGQGKHHRGKKFIKSDSLRNNAGEKAGTEKQKVD